VKDGLFFGNSITYGEYDGVFSEAGWDLKRCALQKYNEGSEELTFYNLDVGDETTEGLIRRISNGMEPGIPRKAI
jgi:acyl-CoA thioesterase I